jgi:glycerol 3-phosphatase-2
MTRPTIIDVPSLMERYDCLFIDSYGVLIDGIDALPGAIELVQRLTAGDENYFIVTNDASRSIDSRAERFRAQGFEIPVDRIVNSGLLIAGYYSQHNLRGRPTVVLGTPDARDYVVAAGGELAELDGGTEPDVVVVAHSGPYDWKSTLEDLLTLFTRRYREGNPIRLVLPNPDFLYQSGPSAFKYGAAAFVELLERALLRLHGPDEALTADRLGKPHAPIFEEAIRRARTDNAVMIGDQLETDILGANGVGIASAIVATGINRLTQPEEFDEVAEKLTPGYILASLL